jgi:hypothetical protein
LVDDVIEFAILIGAMWLAGVIIIKAADYFDSRRVLLNPRRRRGGTQGKLQVW